MSILGKTEKANPYTMASSDREWVGGAVLALGIIHLMFGVSIVNGGEGRFPLPTYSVILDFSGGTVWPYAAGFLVSGLLMVQQDIRVQFLGCLSGILINNLYAALFVLAVIQDPHASGTEWVAYAGYAALNAGVAGYLFSHWRRIRLTERQE